MCFTYFDRLPVELFYEIFSYLSCSQILKSFYSINEYINNIIIGYHLYSLNLSEKYLTKTEFDLICSIISPQNIFRLKLSENRFNLSEKYLNNIKDSQSLIGLRSLWIDKISSINEKLLKLIYLKINFNNLISFRFDSINNQSNKLLFKNLRRLIGCSSQYFLKLINNSIPNQLTFLHMFFNSINDLNHFINLNSNQLNSLGIGIKCQLNNIDQFCLLFKNYQWNKLIQFNLNLQEINDVRLTKIKIILSPMSRLKYLTIILCKQVSIHHNLFNGIEWELFLSLTLIDLKKFNFKFPINEGSKFEINNCLNSFRSSWWLNEKQWFVEFFYQENSFITIPNFCPKIFDNLNIKSFDMMFNPQIFYLNIEELKLNNHDEFLLFSYLYQPHFCNVKRLLLDGYLKNEILNKIPQNINLQTIEHFQFPSKIDDFNRFYQLIVDMTNIYSLDIQCENILDLFGLVSSPFISIRRLVLSVNHIRKSKLLFVEVCRLFPYLTHLTTDYKSHRILIYLLNKLIYLEEINFHLNDKDHPRNENWIKKHTRLINHSFESKIFNINNQERIFSIWINQYPYNQQSQHHKCHIQ